MQLSFELLLTAVEGNNVRFNYVKIPRLSAGRPPVAGTFRRTGDLARYANGRRRNAGQGDTHLESAGVQHRARNIKATGATASVIYVPAPAAGLVEKAFDAGIKRLSPSPKVFRRWICDRKMKVKRWTKRAYAA